MRKMKESKSNCIFCKILKGDSLVSMIYEDDKIAVFPPLGPVNKGHLLIIPKKHSPYMENVDEKTLSKIMLMAQRLNKALRESKYKFEGHYYSYHDNASFVSTVGSSTVSIY